MASQFCSKWLTQNKTENETIFGEQTRIEPTAPTQVGDNSDPKDPSEIVFENNDFKLIVRSDKIKRNHRFKIVDQQFNLLVIPKTSHNHPPLIEILDFLEAGFTFILAKIKTFINPAEHRIAYLTLYQEPMVKLLVIFN